mgnify:CR=1 FL=1
MIKLIVGIKGTGKTKQLISMVNEAVETTSGCVICVEKGNKLIHEIKHQVRLVDADEYVIDDAHTLYGFVSGMFASNHDVTDLFIDSALKICDNNIDEFIRFMDKLDNFTVKHQINIVVTSSIPVEELPAQLERFTK